jgi:hypothetical protein
VEEANQTKKNKVTKLIYQLATRIAHTYNPFRGGAGGPYTHARIVLMEAFLVAIFNPGNAKFELGDHDLVLGPIFITTRINPKKFGTLYHGTPFLSPPNPDHLFLTLE